MHMNKTPEIKLIPFDGDFIHAARTPDGHIYVDIVRICHNLSLSTAVMQSSRPSGDYRDREMPAQIR